MSSVSELPVSFDTFTYVAVMSAGQKALVYVRHVKIWV